MRRALSAVAVVGLLATSLVAATALPASARPTGIQGQQQTKLTPGRYIVTLADPGVATYVGGIAGFLATKPADGEQLNARATAATRYAAHLDAVQKEVATAAKVAIGQSYTLALNGFSANLTATQLAALAADKKVASLASDNLRHLTAIPATSYLGLDGAGGVWDRIGGLGKAGKGTVIGMLDSGIAPENASFAGSPLGFSPGSEPYLSGTTTNFQKSDGSNFIGTCQTGEQFAAAACTTKIISARYFVSGFGASNIGNATVGEYLSPRDGAGHGSHTASTAAGNARVPAAVDGISYDTITGVAPAAKIAVYKVCWSGPNPSATSDGGCATSDLLSGIDQAVKDGVDVINFSIGGAPADSTVSPIDTAFLGAAAGGIFVAAAAGNSGPTASTVDHASPWITTVAASTTAGFEATVGFGDGRRFGGASVTVDRTAGATALTGPLVEASSVAANAVVSANFCLAGTLDPAKTAGAIVVCERGSNARVDKSAEVKRAGGIGMILVNVAAGSVEEDRHAVPTIHLDAKYHDSVLTYAETVGARATFTPENTAGDSPPTPVVASFSSRGPVLADGGNLLKPDISAPGVAILADAANAAGAAPAFQFLSGTSMAAPHIAGLALLYLGVHPNASPAEIKSAMMTTAYDTKTAAGATETNPFVQGSGQVAPTRFLAPGLLYLNGLADWNAYIQGIGFDVGVAPIDPSNLNLASIAIGAMAGSRTVTRTVTSTMAGSFSAQATVAGMTAQVTPSSLSFAAAGETKSFTVTFTRTTAALDVFATGSLTWTSGATSVRSPIAIKPVALVAPSTVSGTGNYGSADITVTPGSTGNIPLTTTGLTAAILQPDPTPGAVPGHSGSSAAARSFQYSVKVAAGTRYARFDLNTTDKSADLDLLVYQLDAAGKPVAAFESASPLADERVNIPSPAAATYLVTVSVFSDPSPTTFDLRIYAVQAGGSALTLKPGVLAAVQGAPVHFTADWAGLAAYSNYLGLVDYGSSGFYTAVAVTTKADLRPSAPINAAPPTIAGPPEVGKTLAATAGSWDVAGLTFSYQWKANGVAVPGAIRATYLPGSADQGKALTVVVAAAKAGLPPGSAISTAILVKYVSTTGLSLSRSVLYWGQQATATIRVSSAAPRLEGGKVVISIGGVTVTELLVSASSPGVFTYQVPKRGTGVYRILATFVPSGDTVAGSSSQIKTFSVIF